MRRKLWLLVILFLFLVGRESCCAAQEQSQEKDQEQSQEKDIDPAEAPATAIAGVFILGLYLLNSFSYWIFDLHQKEEGWYTCKFYYASGYRTKLFFNRIYLDFYYSYFWLACGFIREKPFSYFFIMNINVRIYRDFYIVFCIPVLFSLQKIFLFFKTKFSSQGDIDNC